MFKLRISLEFPDGDKIIYINKKVKDTKEAIGLSYSFIDGVSSLIGRHTADLVLQDMIHGTDLRPMSMAKQMGRVFVDIKQTREVGVD